MTPPYFAGRIVLDFGDWGAGIGRYASLVQPLTFISTTGEVSIPTVWCPLGRTEPEPWMTDGASIPQWLWWFLPQWGHPSTAAALLHDWVCQCLDDGRPVKGFETRALCDGAYREAMLASSVNIFVVEIAYCALRGVSLTTGKG